MSMACLQVLKGEEHLGVFSSIASTDGEKEPGPVFRGYGLLGFLLGRGGGISMS